MERVDDVSSLISKPDIAIGGRCIIKDAPNKRGSVAFVGTTEFGAGYWVGVCLDEPIGRNDGVVDGIR
jgi:dynactin complex subunit